MSNRIAKSRYWLAVGLLAIGGLSGCGDDAQGSSSQTAAGSAARGSAGRTASREDSGTSNNESGGATSAAGSGGEGGMGASESGSAGAAMTPMTDDGSSSWSSIYQFVFWSCRNEGCHGAGLAGVNFATKEAALETMLNQPANPAYDCAKLGKQRVVPGDPDNSLLYLKLDINAPCGQQMPPGGSLSDEKRARVREWIMNGAKND